MDNSLEVIILEPNRPKLEFEHIIATHLACAFIISAAILKYFDVDSSHIYPLLTYYITIIWGLFFTEVALIYLLIRKGNLFHASYVLVDYLYAAFPLLTSGMVLFLVGDAVPYIKAVILLPVIIVGSLKGPRSSYLIAVICSALLLAFDYTNHAASFTVKSSLSDNFLLICAIILVAWFSNAMFALDTRYLKKSMEAADQLRISETQLRRITDNMLDMVCVTDIHGHFEYVSPSFQRILRYDPGILLGKNISAYIHPADLDALNCFFPTFSSGTRPERAEVRFRIETDTYVWLEMIGTLLLDETGQPSGLIFGSRDITLRREIEQALAAEKERLAVTLKSIGEAVIATDRNGCIVVFNAMAEALLGISAQLALGRPLSLICDQIQLPDSVPWNLAERLLTLDRLIDLPVCSLQTKHGEGRLISITGSPIPDQAGNFDGVVLAMQDITEKKRTEAELMKASKLESLGVLAGGLAHDFNNLMMVVMGNISLIKLSRTSMNPDYINEIMKATNQAKRLTQQLLTFAKGGVLDKKSVCLSQTLHESVSFAFSGSNVRCETELDPELWPIYADEGQMNQVINNLVLNAIQSMPLGGVVRISADNCPQVAAGSISVNEGQRFVRIMIQDQGTGILPEHLERIFDPYFTTKTYGSGLGLATAYSIMQSHHGSISVTSSPTGTTFSLFIPAYIDEDDYDPEIIPQNLSSGAERILVMDDDPVVGHAVTNLLLSLGYGVTLTSGGLETIDIYKQAYLSDQHYDLVILDLTVRGGMGGRETLSFLRQIDPGVKAVISSGYTEDSMIAKYLEWGFLGVAAKPFDISELSALVRRVLDLGNPGNQLSKFASPGKQEVGVIC